MIPLRDENPTTKTPVVTFILIGINVLVFLWQLSVGLDRSVGAFGLVPAQVLQGSDAPVLIGRDPAGRGIGVQNLDPAWMTVFTSMFMHGGWLHILGNMWYLWIFGNNVEDDMGHGKFIGFYLLSGVAAAAAQGFLDPDSSIPMVGASGAIGGVLGAYLVLYPGSRVLCLVTLGYFITTMELHAWIVLGFWGVIQVISGVAGMMGPTAGGVAYAAHVGGFLCGMVLGRVLGQVRRPPRYHQNHREYMDWR